MAPPTVEDVAGDSTHGSARVSLLALEALRDGAANADSVAETVALARDLRSARPSMHAVATRVDRAMAAVDEPTPEAVARAADATLRDAARADERAAARAGRRLRGADVLTLSRSGTVADALRAAEPSALTVLESRPKREGVGVAEAFADETRVTLATDAAAAHLLATASVDAVLVGADAVLPDGDVVNKVGTRTVAAAAAREGVETLAVCARDKVAPAGTDDVDLEPGDPSDVYDGDADLTVSNPTFDRTPAALVDGVVTERGVLSTDEIAAVAEEHAALAAWDS